MTYQFLSGMLPVLLSVGIVVFVIERSVRDVRSSSIRAVPTSTGRPHLSRRQRRHECRRQERLEATTKLEKILGVPSDPSQPWPVWNGEPVPYGDEDAQGKRPGEEGYGFVASTVPRFPNGVAMNVAVPVGEQTPCSALPKDVHVFGACRCGDPLGHEQWQATERITQAIFGPPWERLGTTGSPGPSASVGPVEVGPDIWVQR